MKSEIIIVDLKELLITYDENIFSNGLEAYEKNQEYYFKLEFMQSEFDAGKITAEEFQKWQNDNQPIGIYQLEAYTENEITRIFSYLAPDELQKIADILKPYLGL